MATVGRNDPCPCGSGGKYKRCCLAKDEAAEHEQLARAAAAAAAAAAAHKEQQQTALAAWLHQHDLNEASRTVAALLKEGRLDEAEQAARDILVRFPEAHEGHEQLGLVYEARGYNWQAAECYREVIDLVRAHPDRYERGFADTFRRHVARLAPASSQQSLISTDEPVTGTRAQRRRLALAARIGERARMAASLL